MGIEVGVVGEFAIFTGWVEGVGLGGAELVVQIDAAGEKIDTGNLLLGGDLTGGIGPGLEFAANLAVVEGAAGQGGDEDGSGTDGAGFFDEADQILAIGRLRIGFALGAFAGHVVVTELDEDESRLRVDDLLPVAGVAETFAALTATGEVDAFSIGAQQLGEGSAPAGFIGDGGITSKNDAGFGFGGVGDREAEKNGEEAMAEHGRVNDRSSAISHGGCDDPC